MKKPLSFLAGAMCGALVGAVAALLLAPMSGKQLQGEAHSQTDHLIAEARAAAEAKRAQLEAQLAAFKKPHKAEEPQAETPAA